MAVTRFSPYQSMRRATSASVTSEASTVIWRAKSSAARSRSGRSSWSPFRERSPASSRPARRRSASAYAMLYSQRLAWPATHRILPRSIGPSGLRVRCRRSSRSIAAVVRGIAPAIARAQDGRAPRPPAPSVGGSFRQHSSSLNRGKTLPTASRGGAAARSAGKSRAIIGSKALRSITPDMQGTPRFDDPGSVRDGMVRRRPSAGGSGARRGGCAILSIATQRRLERLLRFRAQIAI